jgi:hypothetical protein
MLIGLSGIRCFLAAFQFVSIKDADQIAKCAEGVVVVIFGGFGAAVLGFGGVAVEFGFGEEVGAGAGQDAEGSFFDAGPRWRRRGCGSRIRCRRLCD